jgi:hypothetical protein
LGYAGLTLTDKDNEAYLKMVLEFMPETMYSVLQDYAQLARRMPILEVKLYVYQVSCLDLR